MCSGCMWNKCLLIKNMSVLIWERSHGSHGSLRPGRATAERRQSGSRAVWAGAGNGYSMAQVLVRNQCSHAGTNFKAWAVQKARLFQLVSNKKLPPPPLSLPSISHEGPDPRVPSYQPGAFVLEKEKRVRFKVEKTRRVTWEDAVSEGAAGWATRRTSAGSKWGWFLSTRIWTHESLLKCFTQSLFSNTHVEHSRGKVCARVDVVQKRDFTGFHSHSVKTLHSTQRLRTHTKAASTSSGCEPESDRVRCTTDVNMKTSGPSLDWTGERSVDGNDGISVSYLYNCLQRTSERSLMQIGNMKTFNSLNPHPVNC